MSATFTLGQLAERLGATLRGAEAKVITGLATLQEARPEQLSFLANPRYRDQLTATRASAVIVPAEAADDCPCAALVSPNPYAHWARVVELLHPAPSPARELPRRHRRVT